jgi:hypothetical protein
MPDTTLSCGLQVSESEKKVIKSGEFLSGARKSQKRNVYEISKKFPALFPVVLFDTESAIVYPVIACTLFWDWWDLI